MMGLSVLQWVGGPWLVRCGAHCLVVVRQWMVLGWVGYMVLQLGGALCGSGWDTHCLVMGWTHALVMGGHGLQVVGYTLFCNGGWTHCLVMGGPHCFAMGWSHCLVVGGSHCPVVGGTHGLAVGGGIVLHFVCHLDL